MFLAWLKPYLPRGLYTRALLILILPILLLQLGVSILFINRHFDGVTEQMTDAVSIELQFLIETANQAPDADTARSRVADIADPLQLAVSWPAAIPGQTRARTWSDFTADAVAARLRFRIPQIDAISMIDKDFVRIWIDTRHGPMQIEVNRRRVSASNPHQLLVIMVVLGVILTAISFVFLRNQLRPIQRMAVAATDYGKGRITHYHPSGATEVRAAGMAFLDMRNRLERQIQSRTMMLSGVSHDLRTPLTRLRLGLSLLDEDDAAPLLQDVDDMQRQLDAFLDFARSDHGDALVRVSPQQLVRDIHGDFQRARGQLFLGTLSGPDAPVPLREVAIRRALDNLCNNALRYGSRAEISVYVTDRAVRFVVDDDGPGIPVDRREEAVRPFTRLDPARNQDTGTGVGLGLAIVSDIARSHGGVLRLTESDSLGGLRAELVLAR
ncbi:two-component system, OmpR family, osmolarity sensor histidine kinase EnvZ [Loktanella sp. DSM 29012]|uniref:ATP-binding protein n=1 Tax=Loktanella sp. DSM 29012 TaxID=1881056 RepID=UPI0008D21A95|nr:ATP-binding protein [Loktanella sp. DSM 29012]SEQ48033.1 two-component system, OmpR family, osmolarity sensor histidine kinase EnvZ [Loktanella sp. DSM 29012]